MTFIVNEASKTSSDSMVDSFESNTPDWDRIPFDVNCSRCGVDLRGLSDPICPACKLTFEWSDVAPIEQLTCLHCDYHLYGLSETRCPECGERFSWDEVLTDYHRRQKPLFEYQWREHPIKSFFGTWLRTLRPKKFWTKLDIHDPPQPNAIGVMAFSMVVALLLCFVCLRTLSTWLLRGMWYRQSGRIGTGTWFSMLPQIFMDTINDPELLSVMLTLIVWIVMSFASLLVFQQSMKRYKILTVQIFRVWAYTIPVYPILVCVILFLISYWMILFDSRYYRGADIIAGMVMFLCVTRALQLAYRVYLKMDHSWGVAMASQTIAILSTLMILDLVDDQGYGIRIAIALLDLIH